MSLGFQRARRPEQIEARRTAILGTAREMLAERPVADISLRELSDRVGLAKSNVLRYFDSREAIFLEVLDACWIEWLDDVERALGTPLDSTPGFAREERLAAVLADSLFARRLLCELISSMASVLERNISLEFARKFKRRAAANTQRLADLVSAQIPELTPTAVAHFAAGVFVLVAGMWPFANPTEPVATVAAEIGAPPAESMVREGLTEALANLLAGLIARGR
jgi:AcrR family transcriptional regulator